MKKLLMLLVTGILTTGCGKFGNKLLGIEKDTEEIISPPVIVYEVKGSITGDYMIYGDREFNLGKNISVEVCDQNDMNCQALPYRYSVPKGEASYLVVRGGVFINYVRTKLPKKNRWRARIYQ